VLKVGGTGSFSDNGRPRQAEQRMKRIGTPRLALAVAGCLLAIAGPAATAEWMSKLDRALKQGVEGSAELDVLIRPASLPAARAAGAASRFDQRVGEVVARLRAHADVHHAPLIRHLRAQGIEVRSLWIADVVVARVTPVQLEALARRSDVSRIESDAPRLQSLPMPGPLASAGKSADSVEPNLVALGVPAAWAAGARGEGVVVAGQDSGYAWEHPALRERYRGWSGSGVDHRHNWFDAVRVAVDPGSNPCGFASAVPCDDHGHGSHTMGTAVGDGGVGNRIGVAPDARWIGCRNMDRGAGRPSTYLGCFQFFVAPTDPDGNDPRPALAPHVVVNSWGCPVGAPPLGEDCVLDSLDVALQNVRAAGILTVVSAGNGQPHCGSIDEPPAFSPHVLSVGATDNSGTIAPFSLWGPVTVDGSNRMKPDLVAPGVSVRSAIPGNGYAAFSGTSMSGPAVAGVAALMMGANPLLIGQPDEVGRLLKASAVPVPMAVPCAGIMTEQSPNPVYGHGRVDALAAVEAATTFAVGPGHGGSWFDPARNGEGWIIEILEDGSAVLVWFTYPTADSPSRQDWLIAAGGRIEGSRIRFDDVQQLVGGRFGPAFDPDAIVSSHWGSIAIEFDDCANATLAYAGPAAYGSASRSITRLTSLRGIACGRPFQRSGDADVSRSGAWFDPSRSGEGWLIEALDDGLAAMYWFTYEPDGRMAWLFGLGSLDGGRLQVDDVRRMLGTRFGDDFRADQLDSEHWGSLTIEFDGCDDGLLQYQSVDADYGSGSHPVSRLTRMFGAGCQTVP
jgi:serine protease AprX